MTQPQNTSTFAWIGHQKWILVVTAIIAAVVTAYGYFSSYRPKSEATEYIAKLLHDPESAQFQDVSSDVIGFPNKGDYLVCGKVNGKNLYGAYTGFQPFVYLHDESLSFGFIGNERPVTGDVRDTILAGVVGVVADSSKQGGTKFRKCNLQ